MQVMPIRTRVAGERLILMITDRMRLTMRRSQRAVAAAVQLRLVVHFGRDASPRLAAALLMR